eukprot:8207_1
MQFSLLASVLLDGFGIVNPLLRLLLQFQNLLFCPSAKEKNVKNEKGNNIMNHCYFIKRILFALVCYGRKQFIFWRNVIDQSNFVYSNYIHFMQREASNIFWILLILLL